MQLFLQRRFQHVLIGTRFYRDIFSSGESKLEVGTDTKDLFAKSSGMPPTVGTLDSFAHEAIRDVRESIQSFHFLLQKDELAKRFETARRSLQRRRVHARSAHPAARGKAQGAGIFAEELPAHLRDRGEGLRPRRETGERAERHRERLRRLEAARRDRNRAHGQRDAPGEGAQRRRQRRSAPRSNPSSKPRPKSGRAIPRSRKFPG